MNAPAQHDAFPEARVAKDDSVRRYTTHEFDQWCRSRAGVRGWDLDVAADAEAHLADRWFGVEQNGLSLSWNPSELAVARCRAEVRPWAVWCNPPFDNLPDWVERAHAFAVRTSSTVLCGKVLAFVLPADRVEQPFWQRWVEPFRDGRNPGGFDLRSYYPPGRVKYGHPGNRQAVGVGSANFPTCLLVWKTPGL